MEVVKTLPPVVLAKNDVGFRINLGSSLSGGQKAENHIKFQAFPSAGAKLHLVLRDYLFEWEYEFGTDAQAAAEPQKYLSDNSASLSWLAWLTQLRNQLEQNVLLKELYTFTVFPPPFRFIKLTAKNYGFKWSFYSLPYGVDIDGASDSSLDYRNVSAAVFGDDQEFTIQNAAVTLFVEEEYRSNSFTPLAFLEGMANADGQLDFFLDEYLSPVLSGFEIPEFGLNSFKTANELQRRFKVLVGSNGVLLDEQNETYVALKAGVLNKHFSNREDIFSFLSTEKRFLTNKPALRKVTAEQPEYLYFLNTFDRYGYVTQGLPLIGGGVGAPTTVYDPIKVKCKIYYSDGTSGDHTLFTDTSLHYLQVGYFPCGYSRISVFANNQKEVVAWDVWVELNNQNGAGSPSNIVLCNPLTFELIEGEYLDRFFLYENSYGAFETARVQGERTENTKTEKEFYKRMLPAVRTASDVNIAQKRMPRVDGFENTMAADDEESHRALVEFVDSDMVLFVGDSNYEEVHIPGDEYKLVKDDDFTYLLSFNYTSANTEKAFSQ